MQEFPKFPELSSIIEKINGVITFDIEEGFTEDEDGNEIEVIIVSIHHTFDTFNDPTYEELSELYPDNYDEYEEEEDFYSTIFTIPK
jgi:hypothetical protein